MLSTVFRKKKNTNAMQRWWQEEERVGVNVVERVLKKAEYGER